MKKFNLVVHGGAGVDKTSYNAEEEAAVRKRIEAVLLQGKLILEKGGSSLDTVEQIVRALEDDPLFNAGKGAVLTGDGTVELDAAIMDGSNLKAGAVASVKRIKNPVTAARRVMEETKHVLLVGQGAEEFAKSKGLALVDPSYFFTQKRWDSLQKEKKKAAAATDDAEDNTVGAVALDQNGNLAVATSTGGKTNKMAGRVGDTPLIGAGSYANNRNCAVAGTGDGEYFIRLSTASDVSAMMEYRGLTLQEAADLALKKITDLGGEGGLIALDRNGNIAMPFNTEGMTRGYLDSGGKPVVKIFKNE